MKHLLQISYNHDKNYTISKRKIKMMLESGKGFVKTSMETNFQWKYTNKSQVDLRFFAGAFLYESDNYYGNYNFRLSGWDGMQDYTYSNVFLGRSETTGQDSVAFLERQFVQVDGGFSTFTFLGQTNEWLMAVNVSYKPPIILPLKPYLNLGLVSQKGMKPDPYPFFWETGIEFFIIPDIFGVYFPVFMSSNLKTQSDFISENYWDKVRFTLKFNINDPYLYFKSL